VSHDERLVLEQRVRAKGSPAREVERARIVWLSAEGFPGEEIGARVGCSEPTVVLWRNRYTEKGLAGLEDAPRSGAPLTIPRAVRDEILAITLTPQAAELGITYRSCRLLAGRLRNAGTRSRTRPWPGSGSTSGSSRAGSAGSSSPPIPSWRPRSVTSSGCTWSFPRRPWCSV